MFFMRYLAALAYDTFIMVVLFFALTAVLLLFNQGHPIAPGTFWYQCSLVSIAALYYYSSMRWGGQTLGMRAWRFKLYAVEHGRLSKKQIIGRMLYFIPTLCIAPFYCVGNYTLLHRWTKTNFSTL